MFGKSLVTVGKKPLNAEMAMTRVGLPLEIVPLRDPSKSEIRRTVPCSNFLQDQPLAGETVIATADTIIVKDLGSKYRSS